MKAQFNRRFLNEKNFRSDFFFRTSLLCTALRSLFFIKICATFISNSGFEGKSPDKTN